MKVLSGISVLALLIAGAATPSFADTLAPGGTVNNPGSESGSFSTVAQTGLQNFSFAGDTGQVEEFVGHFSANPFGSSNLTFLYQVTVTGGHIVFLSGYNYTGDTLDVAQNSVNNFSGMPASTNAAVTATLTSDGTVVQFGFGTPDGLMTGDTSYLLIVNTDSANYIPGTVGLLDGGGGTFDGFVPTNATPEPSTLSLLGTGLLAAGAGLRRKMRRA